MVTKQKGNKEKDFSHCRLFEKDNDTRMDLDYYSMDAAEITLESQTLVFSLFAVV